MNKRLKVGVIGAGTMGSGIAQVASTADCEVQLFDTSDDAQNRSAQQLDKVLARLIEKGKIDEAEKQRIAANIEYPNGLSALEDCDIVIEAILENLELKQRVFVELEKRVSEDCILASNTSSLSVTAIAAALERPRRFWRARY